MVFWERSENQSGRPNKTIRFLKQNLKINPPLKKILDHPLFELKKKKRIEFKVAVGNRFSLLNS